MAHIARLSLVAVFVALGASTVARLAAPLGAPAPTKATASHIGICEPGSSC